MRSNIRNRTDKGFTLVEVLVALAIAGGALLLLISSSIASFRKCTETRTRERLLRVSESKFAEYKVGAERMTSGSLPGHPTHSWAVRTSHEDLAPLQKLVRISFLVRDQTGLVFEWAEFRDNADGGP